VQADYEDLTAFEPGATFPAQILVTYTCDVRPSTTAQQVLQQWVENGGRWLALHGTNFALDATPEGWTVRDVMPVLIDTVGSQFVAHPPIQPYTVTNAAPEHWLVKGIEPFEVTDELYLSRYPDRAALQPLLHTEFQGTARGFFETDWTDCDSDHLVMYLRPLGAGAVLYNTLGHCRSHYDMVPMKPYYPNVDRCSWDLPVFYELLRRSLRWARGATGA